MDSFSDFQGIVGWEKVLVHAKRRGGVGRGAHRDHHVEGNFRLGCLHNMFTHTTRLVTLSGRRSMSTVTRKLPTSILSLHRSFPETLYKVNPGERSNIVDPVSFPRSEHFYDRDEVENVVGGHVYPTITSSSPFVSELFDGYPTY